MITTPNFGFKKPEASDYLGPDDFNENFDKLDEQLPKKADIDPATGQLKASQFPVGALAGISEKGTLVDADSIVLVDSADSGKLKRALWSKIRALFAAAKHASQHAASGSDPITPSSIGAAASSHTQAASTVTAGTLAGQVKANASAVTTLSTAQVRNIRAGTADMTAGTTALTTGDIYFVYE